MKEKKYILTLTTDEVRVLAERLAVVSPLEYDLKTFAILRDLYGRLEHKILEIELGHKF